MAEYHVSTVGGDVRVAVIEELADKFRKHFLLIQGVPMARAYPAALDLRFATSGGDMVTDFVANTSSILIVSKKAREALTSGGVTGDVVEFLPVSLRDRRGAPLGEPFFIANVLKLVPCMDRDRSEFATYPNEPNKVVPASLRRLSVLAEKIPAGLALFRLAEVPRRIILSNALVDHLRNDGCTGLNVVPMGAELP